MQSLSIHHFRQVILQYYRLHGRSFPWRETNDPYHILVSEVMLQQTQTSRVRKKYENFIRTFPTIRALAEASVQKLLKEWQGLGYNRRALNLKLAAKTLGEQYGNQVPTNFEALVDLPGIGKATASAILTFAFNQPIVFIETNIRRVFLYWFFPNQVRVADRELLPLIEESLDPENPRAWYYALMDFGAMLGRNYPNPNRRSRHYTVQSQFAGSNRQRRGKLIRMLLEKSSLTTSELEQELAIGKEQLVTLLNQLEKEGFLEWEGEQVSLYSK